MYIYRFYTTERGTRDTENLGNINGIIFSGGPTKGTIRKDKLSSEELLEKLIANLSTDIHQKNRVYKNDLVTVINKIKELNVSSKKQGLLLLKCCTELLPDETPSSRMALVEQIWNTIK